MKKIAYVVFLMLLIRSLCFASEERYRTGFVNEISESSIELKLHSGNISLIGFSCEPNVCQSTQKINVGDEVFLKLGSVNRKNKLLSIKKCLANDVDCNNAKYLELKENTLREKALERYLKKNRECREKMDADLVNDERYHPEKENVKNADLIRVKYNSLNKNPESKVCLSSVVKLHHDAVLETCLKNECGQDIGGGCYHIVGYSLTTSVLGAAVEKCSF